MNRRSVTALRKFTSLMAISTTLSACSTLSGYQPRSETDAVVKARQTKFFGGTADTAYNNETDADKRKYLRNRLIYGKIKVFADQFQKLERALNGTGNGISVGSDLTVLVLNGVAATTGGVATKSALAAASAGIVGAQGAINKDLYYQRTIPAIIAQMQANFEKEKGAIIQNLALSDAEYPLERAEVDLQRLEDAGSIVSAVSQITQQAETTKQAAENKVDKLRALTLSHAPTADRLSNWLSPDDTPDQTHVDALQAWLNSQPEAYLHDLPAVSIIGDAVKVNDQDIDLEPIRARAITDLKIP